MRKFYTGMSFFLMTFLPISSAQAVTDADIEALRNEIKSMKQSYEGRITELEAKLEVFEAEKAKAEDMKVKKESSIASGRKIYDNEFNPSISVILNGKYSSFSSKDSEISGFAVGEEGERGNEGFAVDESELNFSANIDDKFYGSVTAAIVREEGEDKVELEEAYVQTLAGLSLPNGLTAKAGRAFWTFGYLNEHHSHADDFADRPLPNRVFLNKSYNDDGLEVSYVLPTDLYAEIGGGLFRGDDIPFGGSDGEDLDAWSAYARIGGDIGDNMSWRLGGYVLSGESDEGRSTNEDAVIFIGDTDLYAGDLRFTWAPTGNQRNQEITLQGEYFWRDEDGTYEDLDTGTGAVTFDDKSDGWYAQVVYKFLQQWRVGLRYSELESPDVPAGLVGSALDSGGHDPKATAIMADWTNSEFSRLRLQYNHEELSDNQNDDQIMVQYIMSLGAHGAHKY